MNHGGTGDDEAADDDDDNGDETEDGDADVDELINGRAEYEEMRDDLLGDAEQLEEEVGFGEIMINQVRMVMKMERMVLMEKLSWGNRFGHKYRQIGSPGVTQYQPSSN